MPILRSSTTLDATLEHLVRGRGFGLEYSIPIVLVELGRPDEAMRYVELFVGRFEQGSALHMQYDQFRARFLEWAEFDEAS
jgi:hypothetical protein